MVARERLESFAVARRVQPILDSGPASEGSMFGWLEPSGKDRAELSSLLQQAGFSSLRAVQNFTLIRLAISIALAFIVFVWANFSMNLMSMPTAALVMASFVICYFGAGYAVTYIANSRKLKIKQEFTFVLDMFVLTVEAGLSLDQAIRHVARHADRAAPLIQTGLEQMVHEIDTGVTYDVALDRWAKRLGVDEARELAAMFRQSLVHGAPLADSLRNYSMDLCERKMTEAREVAGRIAVRMTLIMVLFFLPALMILIGGPAVHSIMTGLSGTPDIQGGFPQQ